MSDKLDNYRLRLKGKEIMPIVTGGMGVDISNSELAVAIARLGGIGHISDAMAPFVSDKKFRTRFQNTKGKLFQHFQGLENKKGLSWNLEDVKQASFNHIAATMKAKYESAANSAGMVFVNVMEKLSMGDPKGTLRARLQGALDAGIDGITLSAGLHTGTLSLIDDHPRFRDACFGIIVSSARALKIFLRAASRVNRAPDFVVVEGPLAGGHLGFGTDWKKFKLQDLVREVLELLEKEKLKIPVIPAGGIFTGTDAVEYMACGASAIQVATRFTITKECGLPDDVKQIYFQSDEDDVEVNFTSPTGYPMRMLNSSPSLRSNQRPNCEALGYILDAEGNCSYIGAYDSVGVDDKGRKLPITEKMCICTHFMKFQCYTCGHYVYRLKETSKQLPDGSYFLPSAAHVFNDYMHSVEHEVSLPDINSEVEVKPLFRDSNNSFLRATG